MSLRISHTLMLVELVVKLEHLCVEEDQEMLNIALCLGELAYDGLAEANVLRHVVNDRVQIAQLETKGELSLFAALHANDRFEVGSQTCHDCQSLVQRRHDVARELINDALQLIVDFLVKHVQFVCVLQVLLDELKQLAAHLTVDEQCEQVSAQRVLVVVWVHRAGPGLSILDLAREVAKAPIVRAVELEPGVFALRHALVHVVEVELENGQFGEKLMDLLIFQHQFFQ